MYYYYPYCQLQTRQLSGCHLICKSNNTLQIVSNLPDKAVIIVSIGNCDCDDGSSELYLSQHKYLRQFFSKSHRLSVLIRTSNRIM